MPFPDIYYIYKINYDLINIIFFFVGATKIFLIRREYDIWFVDVT